MQNKHFNIDIKMAGKRIKALFMSTVLLIGTFSMLLLTGCSSDTGYDDDRDKHCVYNIPTVRLAKSDNR